MATTSLSLLEERKTRLDVLRAHLAEGASQAARGEFAQNYSVEKLIADADAAALVEPVRWHPVRLHRAQCQCKVAAGGSRV